MGFITNLLGVAAIVVVAPVAVVLTGDPEVIGTALDCSINNLGEAVDDLSEGKIF